MSRFHKEHKGFLLVSLVILLSDIFFVLLNYYSDLNTLKEDTRQWGAQTQKIFTISLDVKALAMQQLATFIASDPRVQALFSKGRDAVAAEGGGPGGPEADKARKALQDIIYPSWEKIRKHHDVHQLHFHLTQDSASFLRVHMPDRFGDQMADIRYMIRDAETLFKPVRGFETGRSNTGIRGAVPVFIGERPDDHLGTLEAVTSFSKLLDMLGVELESNLGILLSETHVTTVMWPDALGLRYPKEKRYKDFFIKAVTHENILSVLEIKQVDETISSGGGSLFLRGDLPLQVTVFPIRDYKTAQDPSLPPSGLAVVWKDASKRYAVFKKGVVLNIIYAVMAFLVLELILFLAWQYSRQRFETLIQIKAGELRASYEKMKALAHELPLGILTIDPLSEKIMDANAHSGKLAGLSIKELIGKFYSDMIKEPVQNKNTKTSNKENEVIESWIIRSDGSHLPVLKTEITTSIQGRPMIISALTDLSEHKKAENEKIKKEKLEGILELAGAVCHEINQPLMVICGHSEMLLEETSDTARQYAQIQAIKEHADRLGKITAQLMNITEYNTQDYLKRKIIDIDKASTPER